jgi:RNA recognition motif-containing protein
MSLKETKKPNVATKKRTLEKVLEPKKKIQKVSEEESEEESESEEFESEEEIVTKKKVTKKVTKKVSSEEESEKDFESEEEIVTKKKVTKKVPLKVSSEEESEEEESEESEEESEEEIVTKKTIKKEVKVPSKKVTKKEIEEKVTKKVSSEEESEEEEEKVVKAKKVNQVPVEDRTLYFSNIPLEFTQKEMLNILKNYGTIEEIRFIWSDKKPGTHIGSAFIQFESKKFSDAAVKDLDKKLVVDKNLIVNYNETHIRNSNQSIQDADAVVVYNLSTETVEKTIQSHFNHCGVIKEVFIPKYDGNISGKAFVNFVVEKNMSKIIGAALKMTGTTIDGREIRVITRVKRQIEPPKKFKQNKF